MADNPRAVIIGLDGVPYDMIADLSMAGVMPNTASLINDGIFKKMNSSIPEISSVAWSSIITGTNPGTHGIFGFMELHPNSYKMRFPNYNDIKAPPFWDQWPGQSVILNVPSTYPVKPMNGAHVSGFVSIDFQKSIYPPELASTLSQMDYRLDVDAHIAHESMDAFLKDLDKTLNARLEAYRYLWENYNWTTFMPVFTGTDRLMHFLYDAYEQKDHKYHQPFVDHFAKIDYMIGWFKEQLTEKDLLVMHSDHGFERLDNEVFVNNFLVKNDFLHFNPGSEKNLENINPATKAFALDPARIYINLKGKYPCGNVEPAQVEEILQTLESLFSNLQLDGKNVIRHIFRKERAYSGPCIDEAPDLILIASEGFNLKAALRSETLFGKGLFTGKHTYDTAFLLTAGNFDKSVIPDTPQVSDIKGIVEKANGWE